MSAKDRIIACLRANRGAPYCAQCLAAALNLNCLAAVNGELRYLAWPARFPDVVSQRGKCTRCAEARVVIYAS